MGNHQYYWCFCYKYYNQSLMIKDYNELQNKNNYLCVSREKELSGKRVFYLVKIAKFINFYSTVSNRNFYEVS